MAFVTALLGRLQIRAEMSAVSIHDKLERPQPRLLLAAVAGEKPAALFEHGGEIGRGACAAARRGGEPRVDEGVEILKLVDRVSADLAIRNWPTSQCVEPDGLAQSQAAIVRGLGAS